MNREEALEKFGSIVSDWNCMEAYVKDGALYYRYDAANPVTEPGQITFNKIIDGATDPVQVCTVEFHEAQKGEKLK